MAEDILALARKARKLMASGPRSGKPVAQALGVSAERAASLVAIGGRLEKIDKAKLTDSEILLLRSLATVHRKNLVRGITCSPKSDHVAWIAKRSDSWTAATVRRRLNVPSKHTGPADETPLGLVDLTGNGYLNLTSLGWMIVHAIESAEQVVADSAKIAA